MKTIRSAFWLACIMAVAAGGWGREDLAFQALLAALVIGAILGHAESAPAAPLSRGERLAGQSSQHALHVLDRKQPNPPPRKP